MFVEMASEKTVLNVHDRTVLESIFSPNLPFNDEEDVDKESPDFISERNHGPGIVFCFSFNSKVKTTKKIEKS